MKELKLPKAFVVYGATLLLVVALVVVSISGGIFRGASDEQGPRLIQVDPEEYKYQDSAVSVLNAISIQSALEKARPGDTVALSPGVYMQDVKTVRNGTRRSPITIKGPRTAIIKGAGSPQIVQIAHNYIKIEGLTLDAFAGSDAHNADSYREKLLKVEDGLTGVDVVGVRFKNTDDAPIVCGPRCDTKVNLVAAAGAALLEEVSVRSNVEEIATIQKTLSPGDSGKDVGTLVMFLSEGRYLPKNDGSSTYDAQVKEAVGAFQIAEKIVSAGGSGLGFVGPKTLVRINELIFRRHLPKGFPEFSVYPGAAQKSSNIQVVREGKYYEVTWETRDALPVVWRWFKSDFQGRNVRLIIPPANEMASDIQYAEYEGLNNILQLSLIRSYGKTKIVMVFQPLPIIDSGEEKS